MFETPKNQLFPYSKVRLLTTFRNVMMFSRTMGTFTIVQIINSSMARRAEPETKVPAHRTLDEELFLSTFVSSAACQNPTVPSIIRFFINAQIAKMSFKRRLDMAKARPGGPKVAPRGPQGSPRLLQEGPKGSQKRPLG